MPGWDELWTGVMGVPELPALDPVLVAAREMAAEQRVASPSPEAGRLLTLLAGERGIRRILQIGAGVGYATACLARGAGQPEVLTLDPDADRQRMAHRLLAEAGLGTRVASLEGEPLDLLQHLDVRFDMIHVATDPETHRRLLDAALTRLELGGVVTVSGVAKRPPEGGEAVVSTFCGYFLMYPQLDAIVLPVGDGLAVGRKISPLVTDQGGPY